MTEKRYFVRIASNMDCKCIFKGEKIKGVISDYSVDGMRILVNSDIPYEFAVGDSLVVKYATDIELDGTSSPIEIKCKVEIRHMREDSGDDYYYKYQLGCQIVKAIDQWE